MLERERDSVKLEGSRARSSFFEVKEIRAGFEGNGKRISDTREFWGQTLEQE